VAATGHHQDSKKQDNEQRDDRENYHPPWCASVAADIVARLRIGHSRASSIHSPAVFAWYSLC
jgi:hypothetical protein